LKELVYVVVLSAIGIFLFYHSQDLGESLTVWNPFKTIQYIAEKWFGLLLISSAFGYSYSKVPCNPKPLDQQDWAILIFILLMAPLFEVLAVDIWLYVLIIVLPSVCVVGYRKS